MYDAEVDTGEMSPEQCAEAIEARILRGPPTAFTEISELNRRR
jgi:hypothetical protein